MASGPEPTWPAAVAETHLSVVVFMGERAYKVKKAVDVGFVDLTSREARERICHREVELNRRLAPDCYLGVLDAVEDGEPVDHLVVMRRLPDDRRLSTLVEEADPGVAEQLRLLAVQVGDFHAAAERSADIDAHGRVEAVQRLWDENAAGLEPFVDGVLDREAHDEVVRLARRYLDGRRPLLDDRIAAGRVVDGHGDLQAADVFCLDDGPRVLDCIEFNDEFRYGDVALDVAFLAMDLERLGAPDLAGLFVRAYQQHTGDTWPRSLLDHYVAYRAHVRCKVHCLRAAQLDGEARAAAEAEAGRLLHTARRWLDAARVRLVLVGGTPGTGKSRLAQGLGESLGWPVLATDELRDELAPRTGSQAAGEGRYRDDARTAVYRLAMERARERLARGESVVLDATWGDADLRVEARDLAEEAVADLVELRCVVDDAVADERIARRLAKGTSASEVTPEVAAVLRPRFDPWPEAVEIDTGGERGDTLMAGLTAVGVDLR